MSILTRQLQNWFTYHTPDECQKEQYEALREAAFEFARAIVEHTPPSADQTTAIRKVREAVMTANAAIACKGE